MDSGPRMPGLLKRYLPADARTRARAAIEGWFRSHRRVLRACDVSTATALLTALLPEWRTDRVYGLQAARLAQRLGRILRLNADDRRLLEAWKIRNRYEGAIEDAMWQFSENPRKHITEVEVFCGFILNKRGSQTRRQRVASTAVRAASLKGRRETMSWRSASERPLMWSTPWLGAARRVARRAVW